MTSCDQLTLLNILLYVTGILLLPAIFEGVVRGHEIRISMNQSGFHVLSANGFVHVAQIGSLSSRRFAVFDSDTKNDDLKI